MIAAGPTALWYATRSTGYVSLLLLTAIVVLGVVTSMRWYTREWPRFLVQALHRNLSLLVLVFLLIHIVTSVADPFAGLTVLNAVAPFTGSYRPIWLGLGVVSMELLVALTVTSLLRQRIGFRAWRVVHWAAYACWPLAMLHTLGTGSDQRSGWAVILGVLCVASVVFALVARLTSRVPRVPAIVRVVALLGTAAVTVAIVGFAAAGPLRAGWAKSAGTPAKLLANTGGSATSTGGAAPTPTPAPTLATGLSDQLTGAVTQNGRTVQVNLTDRRDPSIQVLVAVRGESSTGQITITRAGAVLCNTSASVVQDVTATCGHTAVDISLAQQADGTIAGQMVTRAAG